MTKEEMVRDMLDRQHRYDAAVEQAHDVKLTELDSKRIQSALLDEIGELNHTMKSRWCWWKKSQKPENFDDVLEELADVWHFSLMIILLLAQKRWSLTNSFVDGVTSREASVTVDPKSFLDVWTSGMLWMLKRQECFRIAGERLRDLTAYCGFSIEEVYQAYIEKNDVNFKRIEEGY